MICWFSTFPLCAEVVDGCVTASVLKWANWTGGLLYSLHSSHTPFVQQVGPGSEVRGLRTDRTGPKENHS